MIVKLFSFIWLLINSVDTFPRRKYNFTVPSEVKRTVPDAIAYSMIDLERLITTRQDPEVSPGLFQGDIAMTNEHYNYWRIALRWDIFPDKLWKNRTVSYVISPLYKTQDYITIYKAITYLNYMTCINFVPWDEVSKDFIIIWPMKYPSGCWSFIGRFGGAQLLSLQPPDERGPNCLGDEGRAIHELMHALGIFHEQARADRDDFVDIHYENIMPDFLINFDKQSLENTTYSYEYDYQSIMHYGSFYFSKNPGKPTITPKIPGAILGQRKSMTKTDCLKVNELYGCLNDSSEAKRWYNICNALGI
ncbi:hatching enzyme 1.2-like [Aphidius gifuensis]|uniref:hatching enzyme 1.2-like n=1 Tax=Aphidius gifuensis TaxID=684658 RepID=UPI001CDB73FB|nr:hatching enzyme 1.2-like [Aphidius gifuensis]